MEKKEIYTQKKSYIKYDEKHYLLYLHEESVPDYVAPVFGDEEPQPPMQAYAYTGDHVDGGTMVEATEASYDAFVNGLIRKRYSADRVEAIILNSLNETAARSAEFGQELAELEAYRAECKEQAKKVLGI